MVKILNLGCGFYKMKGAVNVDIRKECNPDKVVDFEKKLPFKDNEFDKIVSSEVFEHIKGVLHLAKECNRILKPGGKLVVSVPYHGRLKNLIIALLYFDMHFHPHGDHIRFFTKNTLSQTLRGGGFKIKRIEYSGRIKPLSNLMTMHTVSTKIK